MISKSHANLSNLHGANVALRASTSLEMVTKALPKASIGELKALRWSVWRDGLDDFGAAGDAGAAEVFFGGVDGADGNGSGVIGV